MSGELTEAFVRTVTKPKMHHDGGGLYFKVAKGGSKSWVHRATIGGKVRDMGLGGYPAVTLAAARKAAAENRAAIAAGRDPLAEKRAAVPLPGSLYAAIAAARHAKAAGDQRLFERALADCFAAMLEAIFRPEDGGGD